MTTFLLTSNGLKNSISINAVPESSWHSVFGATSGDSDVDIIALYESIPWLHRGVEARVNALANLPVAIHADNASGEEVDVTTLPFRLNLRELLPQLYRWYILFARAYVWRQRNLLNEAMALKAFHPNTIKEEYDPDTGLTGYKRTVDATTKPYPKEEIARVVKEGARNEVSPGVSDAMVSAHAAGVLQKLDELEDTLYKNGAINPTLITVPAGTRDSDKERLRSWYKRFFGGVKKAFSLEVVEGPKPEVVTLGHRPKDLAATEITTQKREEIATALGVPQTLMFSNAANYATAKQDDLHFYDKTILPDARKIADALNILLMQEGYCLVFHPERMELFQQLEDSKATAVTLLVDKGVMQMPEARSHMNLPPLLDDDASLAEQRRQKQFEELRRGVESGIPVEICAAVLGIELPETVATDTPATAKSKYQIALTKWQRMAEKRYQENHPQKALSFQSEDIPTSTAAAIRGQLSAVKDARYLAAIFKNAAQFEGYP